MQKIYERAGLAILSGLVIGCGIAVLISPPPPITSGPKSRAVFKLKDHRNLSRDTKVFQELFFNSYKLNLIPGSEFSWKNIEEKFKQYRYSLDDISSGVKRVPRIFVSSLPKDLADMNNIKHRKRLFFKIILPLVLKENEKLLRDRSRLWQIIVQKRIGKRILARDRLWLATLAESFKVKQNDLTSLLARVDIIPPSLALAQAAEESGWGTSRFAKYANAIFGQWTTQNDIGLIPNARNKGETHKIKKFKDLSTSITAYIRNLNTHRAYQHLRKIRSTKRRQGSPISGIILADGLTKYSERGKKYVKILRTLILANSLGSLDDVRLEKKRRKISAIFLPAS